MSTEPTVSIVIPARNEAIGLEALLRSVRRLHPGAELIVVDDGSDDGTAEIARSVDGVTCISHPISIGNGGAVKTGARHASGDRLVFMDGDGQHRPEEISRLLERMDEGYHLVVGARVRAGQASLARSVANRFYNKLASMMTGFVVEDLTSGFRAFDRRRFLTILYLLPNRFSYPTTSTMAFFRSGYFVSYVGIDVRRREGKSHVRMLRDGMRFMIIILKIGALFSPMRFFLPVSAALFSLACVYYLYTYLSVQRFTNMGMLLYLSALTTFMLGILSEQISALHYRDTSGTDPVERYRAGAKEMVTGSEGAGHRESSFKVITSNDTDSDGVWHDAA